MASKEFITKRINGKIREIEKLNAKLERIEKAEMTNWAMNPYYYDESDKCHTLKDLAAAKEALLKYEEELVKAEEMEASRNVPAITEFLDRWYDNCVEYFRSEREKYNEAVKEYTIKCNEFSDWYKLHGEERKQHLEEYSKYKRDFASAWSHVTQFCHGELHWDDTMQKDLREEYNRKYDFIITRTNEIVGQITDAGNLRVGAKGDLNGYIVGTKGCCTIKTIGAGGYNIQCFHFRTLIRPYTLTAPKAESKPQITTDTNFKAMSIEELKDICTKLGAECKVYSNEAIYRMRLVMAIKKAI